LGTAFGWSVSPEGAADYDADVSRPFGTGTPFDSPPKAEALGYARASLREKAAAIIIDDAIDGADPDNLTKSARGASSLLGLLRSHFPKTLKM
jgi:hypothetical protein